MDDIQVDLDGLTILLAKSMVLVKTVLTVENVPNSYQAFSLLRIKLRLSIVFNHFFLVAASREFSSMSAFSELLLQLKLIFVSATL